MTPWLRDDIVDRARHLAPGERAGALTLARELSGVEEGLGYGTSWSYFGVLGTLGSVDLTVARTLEPHLDAVRQGSGWVLDGTKPWCSLAAELSHAIITAHTGPTSRRAFAISLGDGVSPLPGTWVSRGLIDVPSGGLQLDGVAAVSVGEDE